MPSENWKIEPITHQNPANYVNVSNCLVPNIMLNYVNWHNESLKDRSNVIILSALYLCIQRSLWGQSYIVCVPDLTL